MTRCSSPTCMAAVPQSTSYAVTVLGWAIEQQQGDDKPMIYCERCRT